MFATCPKARPLLTIAVVSKVRADAAPIVPAKYCSVKRHHMPLALLFSFSTTLFCAQNCWKARMVAPSPVIRLAKVIKSPTFKRATS